MQDATSVQQPGVKEAKYGLVSGLWMEGTVGTYHEPKVKVWYPDMDIGVARCNVVDTFRGGDLGYHDELHDALEEAADLAQHYASRWTWPLKCEAEVVTSN